MHPTVRDFYNLEEIWGGKPVKLKRGKTPAKKARPRAKAPRRRRSR